MDIAEKKTEKRVQRVANRSTGKGRAEPEPEPQLGFMMNIVTEEQYKR